MKRLIFVLAGFYIGFVVFMPKEELFFALQRVLKKHSLLITSNTSEDVFSLKLDNMEAVYSNIPLLKAKKASVFPLIIFNYIKVKDVKIDFNNLKISDLTITHSLLNPLKLFVKGRGSIGEINGYVSLKEVKIYIKKPPFSIRQFLQRDKKGYFYYEKF